MLCLKRDAIRKKYMYMWITFCLHVSTAITNLIDSEVNCEIPIFEEIQASVSRQSPRGVPFAAPVLMIL